MSMAIPTEGQTRDTLSRSVTETPSAHHMPAAGPAQTSQTPAPRAAGARYVQAAWSKTVGGRTVEAP